MPSITFSYITHVITTKKLIYIGFDRIFRQKTPFLTAKIEELLTAPHGQGIPITILMLSADQSISGRS